MNSRPLSFCILLATSFQRVSDVHLVVYDERDNQYSYREGECNTGIGQASYDIPFHRHQ